MNWFPLPNGKALVVFGSVGLIVYLAISNWGYRKDMVLAQQTAAEQQKTLTQQSRLISTLQEQDRKNRALAAEQLRREQQLRQRGERYQRELREALKNDKCGNSLMPAAVIDLLQQNSSGAATGNTAAP